MNIYSHRFWAQCPNDKAQISYLLRIETGDVIMAERIEQECRFREPIFHEEAADRLLEIFGGAQTLSATHGQVDIVTKRGINA
ncbi:MAG: hypothetical protein E5V63_13320 [Mesorhizobium sp.]|nr:MAG: hypothetical protein E5V63_13320 [Mesorhizobium sp.]